MAAKQHQQSKKGGRKIGRNRVECERYRKQGRREKNKLRKLARHVRDFPNDEAARRALASASDGGGARGSSRA